METEVVWGLALLAAELQSIGVDTLVTVADGQPVGWA